VASAPHRLADTATAPACTVRRDCPPGVLRCDAGTCRQCPASVLLQIPAEVRRQAEVDERLLLSLAADRGIVETLRPLRHLGPQLHRDLLLLEFHDAKHLLLAGREAAFAELELEMRSLGEGAADRLLGQDAALEEVAGTG